MPAVTSRAQARSYRCIARAGSHRTDLVGLQMLPEQKDNIFGRGGSVSYPGNPNEPRQCQAAVQPG